MHRRTTAAVAGVAGIAVLATTGWLVAARNRTASDPTSTRPSTPLFARNADGSIASVRHSVWEMPASENRASWGANRSLGTPKSFRNLTLIPVFARTSAPVRLASTFTTLDEGLKSGRVAVTEPGNISSNADNAVSVENRDTKPLFIPGGEVVTPGHQDRMIRTDVVIAPGEHRIVPVYCVEENRSFGPSDEFTATAGALAGPGIRSAATDPIFSDSSARIEAAQRTVWSGVGNANASFGTRPQTGTYVPLLDLKPVGASENVNPYLYTLPDTLPENDRLIGIVAAVNGKVIAADVFGDPSLLRRLYPKLLRSYAIEAARRATGGTSSIATVASAGRDLSAIEPSMRGQGESGSLSAERRTGTRLRDFRFVLRDENNGGDTTFVHQAILPRV